MYLPEYMGSLGIDPYFNMFTVFIGEIPGLVLAMILIEPHMFGRIKCLRFFSAFTAVGLLLFAFIHVDFLKAVFVIVVYFFMVPVYSILNTYTPEVYPTDNRSMAVAWMYMVIAFPGLITAFLSASVLSTNITWLYPTVAAAFFSLQFLFTFGLRSETAGQGLNDASIRKNQEASTCQSEVSADKVQRELNGMQEREVNLEELSGNGLKPEAVPEKGDNSDSLSQKDVDLMLSQKNNRPDEDSQQLDSDILDNSLEAKCSEQQELLSDKTERPVVA